jgi:hypothetical protein
MEQELVPGESPPTPLGQIRIGAINVEKTNVAKLEQLVCLARLGENNCFRMFPHLRKEPATHTAMPPLEMERLGTGSRQHGRNSFEPGAVSHLACI